MEVGGGFYRFCQSFMSQRAEQSLLIVFELSDSINIDCWLFSWVQNYASIVYMANSSAATQLQQTYNIMMVSVAFMAFK